MYGSKKVNVAANWLKVHILTAKSLAAGAEDEALVGAAALALGHALPLATVLPRIPLPQQRSPWGYHGEVGRQPRPCGGDGGSGYQSSREKSYKLSRHGSPACLDTPEFEMAVAR